MMEFQMRGMLEYWMYQVKNRADQQVTCSGPEGGVWCAEPGAHDILEGIIWSQVCQWDKWKQDLIESYSVNPWGGVRLQLHK